MLVPSLRDTSRDSRAFQIPELPNEMWLHILSNLQADQNSLLSASLTCRKWKQIVDYLQSLSLPNLLKNQFSFSYNKLSIIRSRCHWAISKYAIAVFQEHHLIVQPFQSEKTKIVLNFSRYKVPEKFLHVAFLTKFLLFILTDKRYMLYNIEKWEKIDENNHPFHQGALSNIKYSEENKGIAFSTSSRKRSIHVFARKIEQQVKIPKRSVIKGLTIQKTFAAFLFLKKTLNIFKRSKENHWQSCLYIKSLTTLKVIKIKLALKSSLENSIKLIANHSWIVIYTSDYYAIYSSDGSKQELENFQMNDAQFSLFNHHLIVSSTDSHKQETIFSVWDIKEKKRIDLKIFPTIRTFDCRQGIIAMISQKTNELILWKFKDQKNEESLQSFFLSKKSEDEDYQFIRFYNKRIVIESSKKIDVFCPTRLGNLKFGFNS